MLQDATLLQAGTAAQGAQPSPADNVQLWAAALVVIASMLSGLLWMGKQQAKREERQHDEAEANRNAIEQIIGEQRRYREEVTKRLDDCQRSERELSREFRSFQSTTINSTVETMQKVLQAATLSMEQVKAGSERNHDDQEYTRRTIEELSRQVGALTQALLRQNREL